MKQSCMDFKFHKIALFLISVLVRNEMASRVMRACILMALSMDSRKQWQVLVCR